MTKWPGYTDKYCSLFKYCPFFQVYQFIRNRECCLSMKCFGSWKECPMRRRKGG